MKVLQMAIAMAMLVGASNVLAVNTTSGTAVSASTHEQRQVIREQQKQKRLAREKFLRAQYTAKIQGK